MNNALTALPIIGRTTQAGASPIAAVAAANPIAKDTIGRNTSLSWADVLNAVHGSSKGGHSSGLNKIQSSTDSGQDAFGASASSSDQSVDAFGTPSATPSSTASLIASISDPFTSIASGLQVRAQLQSQSMLKF